MNGAELLLRTLLANDVDLVLGNPGTSEMQLVSALDRVPRVRAVLALFEGVVTGAADGYGRMADRPAATLLHLGPGLANGLANLHNARRARTPIVNLVGDHATYHRAHDAPLASDIASAAGTVSGWVRSCESAADASRDAAAAVAAARTPPGQVATLIVPADVAWSDASGEPARASIPGAPRPSQEAIDDAARALRSGEPAALLLDGRALRAAPLAAAARIGARTSARVMCDTFPARLERGAGRAAVERLPYLSEMVAGALAGLRHVVLVGARAPVSFFAFPGRPSELLPDGCMVHTLASPGQDAAFALDALADALGARAPAGAQPTAVPPAPSGRASIDPHTLGLAIAATLPEGAIVIDEGNTAGFTVPAATAGCPPHDWLCLTGGSIGMGLPAATGAALACPGRRVVALEGDGSAMYTIQALWTQAREGLDVTSVILSNRSYAILNLEMMRMGLGTPGPAAARMLDIAPPELDFAAMGRSMGVPSVRARTADELVAALRRSFATPGPALVEAAIWPPFGGSRP